MKAKSIHDGGGSSVRSDSWAVRLTESQQWELYYKSKQPGVTWVDAAKWAVGEFHLAKTPSHSAFYRWRDTMRKLEFEQELKESTIARMHNGELAKTAATDEQIIVLLKSMATAEIVNGNVAKASALLKNAAIVQNFVFLQSKAKLQVCDMGIKGQMLELAKRRWKMTQEKFKMEKKRFKIWERKANPPPQPKMSDEEREAKIKEILGIRVDFNPMPAATTPSNPPSEDGTDGPGHAS